MTSDNDDASLNDAGEQESDASAANNDAGDDDVGGATSYVIENTDPNTIRILLSTDNHLGYGERNEGRGDDSFAAFEEIMYIAQRFRVDFVLLSGDLFHDNRPSRRTMHKTMEILRRYCMGPNPVQIQVLPSSTSNDTANLQQNRFRNGTKNERVNYQDPNYSVQLPIFSIHGNHDDPSRDGAAGGGELLAALDLLSITNLLNYFGRQDEVDKVNIAPVLLQKGTSKVALYGLGSLRDERLNRMFEKNKVGFLQPDSDSKKQKSHNDDDDEDSNDDDNEDNEFFNIFTLHQNRELGRGAKNCVKENMIPEWMDLVVWGHEHECLIEFFESVVGTYRISQPGSSIATSLVAGEATQKKVGILDIQGQNFRLHPVPLTQVRSFVTTEISLKDHSAALDPEDPKIEFKMSNVLEEGVQLMVLNARTKREDLLKDALKAGNDTMTSSMIKYKLQNPDEVLVRIRVEHQGYASLNNQRFGARFVGDVANPSDILLFHRKRSSKTASTVSKNKIAPIAPEELERTNMEDLVREHLNVPNGDLKLLASEYLEKALVDYVEKGQIHAVSELSMDLLEEKQKILIKNSGEKKIEKESHITEQLDQEAEKRMEDEEAQRMNEVKQQDDDSIVDENSENDDVSRRPTQQRKGKAAGNTGRGKENSSNHVMNIDSDDDDDDFGASSSRTTSKTSTKGKSGSASRSNKNLKPQYVDSDENDNESIEAPASRRRPAAASTRATTTTRTAGRKRRAMDSDEDAIVDSDVDEDDVEVVEPKSSKSSFRGKPAAAKTTSARKGRKKAAPVVRTTVTSGTSRRGRSAAANASQTSTVSSNRMKRRAEVAKLKNDSSSDDEVEYDGTNRSTGLDEDWGVAQTASQRDDMY